MDECKETPRKCNNVNGDRTQETIVNNTINGLHNGVGKQDVVEKKDSQSYENAIVTQEKNKILQVTTELQEIIINILQQKLKLSDMRNKPFMNVLTNGVKDVQKASNEAIKKYLESSGENISEFKVIMEFLDSVKTESGNNFTINTEKFVEECHRMFMKYEEMYRKSKLLLSNYLKNLEKVLKINELPTNCELQQRVLFSTFEEKLVSYNRFLASSEKAIEEFESLIKNDVKIPERDIDKTINVLITVFNKAEYSFGLLKLLAIEVLRIDFAKV